jgi:hypothetical protein
MGLNWIGLLGVVSLFSRGKFFVTPEACCKEIQIGMFRLWLRNIVR